MIFGIEGKGNGGGERCAREPFAIIWHHLLRFHLRLSLGSFQAAVLLPVNVCCANRCNVWQILELRCTFEEGACSRLTKTDRTFDGSYHDNENTSGLEIWHSS